MPSARVTSVRPFPWVPAVLFGLTFLTYSLTIIRYLDSPLRFDEAPFADQAAGILRHGVPKIPYSEDRNLLSNPLHGYSDARYGMWHPPLFLYSLAGSVYLFGPGNVPLRMAPLAWFLLSLGMVWLITRRLGRKPRSSLEQAAPLMLVLLSPLLAEGSLFVDIDNTSLSFSLLLFSWIFLRDPDDFSVRRHILLALAFSLCLFSKLTSPFIFLAAAAAYHILNGRGWKGLVQVLTVGVGGTALFGMAYWAYCAFLNYPPLFMLEYTYVTKWRMYSLPNRPMAILHAVRWSLFWISPAVSLALGTALAWRIKLYGRMRRLEKEDFLWLSCLAGLSVYVLWAGMWGKYSVPFVLAGIAAMARPVAEALGSSRIRRPGILASSALLLAGFHAAIIPPLVLRVSNLSPGTASWGQALADPRNGWLALSLVSIGLFCVAAWRNIEHKERSGRFLVISLMCALSVNPVLAAKLLLSSGDRSPYHPLRESGFMETVKFLNQGSQPGQMVFVPQDMGYYLKGDYLPLDAFLALQGALKLQEQIPSIGATYVVDSERFPLLSEQEAFLQALSFKLIRRIGDYNVYRNAGDRDEGPAP